jgi:hypothetical protein
VVLIHPNVAPDTFIKVTEIWGPDSSGENLRLRAGAYGNCAAFQKAANQSVFAVGEGLPGQAWAARKPVIWTDLQVPAFHRNVAALADGLTTGVALPIFTDRVLVAVVVFFCGTSVAAHGAIEVWSRLAGELDALRLEAGYYGGLPDMEQISRGLEFRMGQGLPGVVWEVERPCVMSEIGVSGAFFRAAAARKGRLTSALGIPCSFGQEDMSVLCLLSSSACPIARRYEIWVPAKEEDRLRQAFAVGDGDQWSEHDAMVRLARGEGVLGRVWETGQPVACEDFTGDESAPIVKARESGLGRVVSLPTFRGGAVAAIVAWYF